MRIQTLHRLLPVLVLLQISLVAAPALAAQTNAPPQLRVDPTTRVDLSFPEPVSARQAYEALARAFDVGVDFASRLKDSTVQIDLRDVSFHEALDAITTQAGHFAAPRSPQRFVVADDTPYNRRLYEPMVIQTFPLRHARPTAIMTILRSMLSAKVVATDESLNAIVLRGTPEFLTIAEHLISTHDHPAAEVAVDFDLLRIDREARQRLRWNQEVPGRITAEELAALRGSMGSNVLATTPLSLLDRGEAHLRHEERLPTSSSDAQGGIATVRVGLTLSGLVHGDGRGVRLDISLEGSSFDDASHRQSHRELASQVHLAEGEIYLVPGLLTIPGTGADDSYELAVVLTPRVERPRALSAGTRHALWVGSETHLRPAVVRGPLADEALQKRLRDRLRELEGHAASAESVETP